MTTHPSNIGWLDWESLLIETRPDPEPEFDWSQVADAVWADDETEAAE